MDELLKTDDTIETVSANAGFPNSHAFVQAFKREYGVLPSVYRRKNTGKKSAEAIPLSLEQSDYMAGLKPYLEQPLTPQSAAQARACRASVSAQGATGTLRHSWRELTGVSSASALLLSDVQALLRRTQEEIGFRSIKFNGILSEDMHVYSENAAGEGVYSFAFVDKVFDFLLELGLRPFVQLGFMPEALARTHKRLFGYLISEPEQLKNGARFGPLLTGIAERYGRETLRRWRFSVWHQPDTTEPCTDSPQMKRFMHLSGDLSRRKNAATAAFFWCAVNLLSAEEGHENRYLSTSEGGAM